MGAQLEESDVDPIVGRVIDDRFEIVELIARGGMGKVYRARQRPLGREVALKVLDPRYDGEHDPDFQGRFFLEASTVAKLTHPNTVTVFDYGKTTDGVYYIAMELVDGDTLANVLRRDGVFEPLRAIHVALQIARSVREAHGLGVVHRDLKPANVLLTQHDDEHDFVKVLDFGLVKDLKEEEDRTQQGLFMGSPKYMSPEAIRGVDIDARSDVYSLGVMMYQLLSGRVPFAGATSMQTLMAHINEGVPPLERADGLVIPEVLQRIVLKALAKDKEQRFGSMHDFIRALKHASALMGSPIGTSGSYSLPPPGSTPSGGIRIEGALPDDLSASITHSAITQSSMPPAEIPARMPSDPPRRRGLVAGVALGAAAIVAVGITIAMSSPGPAPEPPRASAMEPGVVVAPEPAPPRCEITLRSTPPGAEVWVGSRGYGQTPASIVWEGDAAAPGTEVTFLFELAGHAPATVTRTISGGALLVEASLEPVAAAASAGPMTVRPRRPRPAAMSTATGESLEVRIENYRDNPY